MMTVNKRETSFEGLVSQLENGEDGIYNLMNENKNQTIQWIIEVFMFMNLGNEVNGDLNGIGKIIIEGICHGYEIGIQYLFTALGTTG